MQLLHSTLACQDQLVAIKTQACQGTALASLSQRTSCALYKTQATFHKRVLHTLHCVADACHGAMLLEVA